MFGRRWSLVLGAVLLAQLLFAVLVLFVEIRAHGPGTRLAVAGLVWVGLGLPLAAWAAAALLLARRELELRVQALAATATTSHDWLWECDTDHRITYTNDAVTDLLGYAPHEVIGRLDTDFMYGDSDRRAAAPFHDLVLTSKDAQTRDGATGSQAGWSDVELSWRHRDGSPVRLLGSAAPIYDHRGHVVGVRGTRRLVTAGLHSRAMVKEARGRVSALLSHGDVRIALQPIVDVTFGWVAGVEALARFDDGRGPDAWFGDAQLAGRARELDELTFFAALELFEELPDSVYLSVNASPALLLDSAFRTRLLDTSYPLDRLVVEITEHARVGDYGQLNSGLEPLRERGVRFAIDDTGAGYASLSHVLRLNPDIIKLDRDLIDNLETDRARRSLVTALVLLALDVGARVTGEGVETPAQLETLATLGVDQVQGYLLARPTYDTTAWARWWSDGLTTQPPAHATRDGAPDRHR